MENVFGEFVGPARAPSPGSGQQRVVDLVKPLEIRRNRPGRWLLGRSRPAHGLASGCSFLSNSCRSLTRRLWCSSACQIRSLLFWICTFRRWTFWESGQNLRRSGLWDKLGLSKNSGSPGVWVGGGDSTRGVQESARGLEDSLRSFRSDSG